MRSRQWSALAALLVLMFFAQKGPGLFAQTRAQAPVRVAAAADLEPLLPALLRNYERQTGEHVEASFASSATLATQIENGAPFDVFLSADMALPEKIVHDGFAAAGGSAQPYARGTLVLWTRNQSGVPSSPCRCSHRPRYTASPSRTRSTHPTVAPQCRRLPAWRCCPRSSPSCARQRTSRRQPSSQAPAMRMSGLISLTSALTLTAQGHYAAVPEQAYQPILQGAVALKGGANPKGAAAFLRYLHSPAVAQQLQQGGLAPVR